MKKNKYIYFILVLLGAVSSLSSCWKEDMDDCPETAGLTLVTQWDNRSPHVSIPTQYIVNVGDYNNTLSGIRNTLNHEFIPGDYRGYVYNQAENLSINTAVITVDPRGGNIDNLPGYIFTWSDEIKGLGKSERREIIAPMKQQVGEIHYEIVMEDGSNISNYIKSINGVTLSGIASKLNIETNEHYAPSSIAPEFTLDNGKYTSVSRILGTVGTAQQIAISYELQRGSAGVQTLTRTVTSFLEGFNDNKTGAYKVMVVMMLSNIRAQLTLETQWNNRSIDAAIPANYEAIIGNYTGTLAGLSNIINHDFAPGNHHVNVYNTPDKFSFENMYATVNTSGSGIDAMPGYLFSYTGDVIGLTSAESRTITAPMVQQVGTINYRIVMKNGSNVNTHISGVTAKLDGIASRINLENGALSMPSSIAPVFSANLLEQRASSRILGTIGANQTLTLNLALTGSAGQQTLSKDLSTILSGFNADKLGNYTIVIEIETVNGLTGEIIDWTVGGDFTGDLG